MCMHKATRNVADYAAAGVRGSLLYSKAKLGMFPVRIRVVMRIDSAHTVVRRLTCALQLKTMNFSNHVGSLSIFLFLVLSLNVSVSAQPPSPTIALTPTPASSPPQSNPNDEVIALRAQIEIMRQYDQKLLDTVYWALGVLVGITLLVVGLGWYTNFKVYKRDVEDLKRDFKNELLPELTKVARQAGESAVKSALESFREVQYKQLKLEADKWEKEGVYANALRTYSEMIELANAILAGFYVPGVLDEMLRLLREKDVRLRASTIADVNKELDKVPSKYSATVEAIKEIMRTPKPSQPRA